ncbi:hypothetical protein LWH48_17785, partial [Halomonas sp. G15]|uniref:hypothetical protein n=1 Tax=Halomonas sp. G15 TaxID=2903521 RepID=UPI001E2FFDDC
ADADVLNVIQLRRHQPLQVLTQVLGLHHHGVAAGHQQVGDLGMLGQVAVQGIRFIGGELQVLVADELRPAEAEGAVAEPRRTSENLITRMISKDFIDHHCTGEG